MVVKVTMDFAGNVLAQEKVSDEKADLTGLVDYYADKFVKLTEEREKATRKKKIEGDSDV